jgi:hypothetical protein
MNVLKSTLALLDTGRHKVGSLLRSDLEADAAVLQFLPIVLLHMAGSDTLEPILTEWNAICDKTLPQIEALDTKEEGASFRSLIVKHTKSTWILRTATITWMIYQLW